MRLLSIFSWRSSKWGEGDGLGKGRELEERPGTDIGSAKQTWSTGEQQAQHTYTPQDKYHTVHRYMDIVTWQEIEGQWGKDLSVCTKERH